MNRANFSLVKSSCKFFAIIDMLDLIPPWREKIAKNYFIDLWIFPKGFLDLIKWIMINNAPNLLSR